MAATLLTAATLGTIPAYGQADTVFNIQLATNTRMACWPIHYQTDPNRWKWQGVIWYDRGTAGWRRLGTCTFFVEDNTDDSANWTAYDRSAWTVVSGTWANYNSWDSDDGEVTAAPSNYVRYSATAGAEIYLEFTVPAGYRYATLDYNLPAGIVGRAAHQHMKLIRDPSGDAEYITMNGMGYENYEEREPAAGYNEPDNRNGCWPLDGRDSTANSNQGPVYNGNVGDDTRGVACNMEVHAGLTPGETYRLYVKRHASAAAGDWAIVGRVRIRDWVDESTTLPVLTDADKHYYGLEWNIGDLRSLRKSVAESAYAISWNSGSFMGGSHGNETVVTDTWAVDTNGDGTYDGTPTWTTGVWDGPHYALRLTHDADLNDGAKRADLLCVEECDPQFKFGLKTTLTITWTNAGNVTTSYISMHKTNGTEADEPTDLDNSTPWRMSDVVCLPDNYTLADPHTLAVDSTGYDGTSLFFYNNDHAQSSEQDLVYGVQVGDETGGNHSSGTNRTWFDASNAGKCYRQIAEGTVAVSSSEEWSFVWFEGWIGPGVGFRTGPTATGSGGLINYFGASAIDSNTIIGGHP